MAKLPRGFVSIGLGSIVLYVLLPSGATPSWLYQIVSISAPIAIIAGLLRHRPAVRAPWLLLALGFALYVIGDGFNTAYSLSASGVTPFPNPGDAMYLTFYPLVFVALVWFVRASAHRDRAAWLDAMIWTVGAATLAWEPLLEPYTTGSGISFAGLVSLAYPLMDIALLLMLVRLFVGGGPRSPAFWLIMAAFSFQTVSDVLYDLQLFGSSSIGSHLMDAGWLVTYVAIGGAALHPSMVEMTRPHAGPQVLTSRRRLVFLIIPTLLAPGLVVYQLATHQLGHDFGDGLVVAAASTSLVLLVLARGAGLLVIAERRSDQLEGAMSNLRHALADRERSNAELNHRVTTDCLTGLANRAYFVTTLEQSLASGSAVSIAFLDMDDFKSINDTLGHEAGDLLLIDLARRLRQVVGPDDLVARFGGDEFAVLVKGDVEQVAEQLLHTLEQPMLLDGRELLLQLSIGVTTANHSRPSSGDLLRRADIAMYTAKRAGGGWRRYQTGMSELLRDRTDLQARLITGLRDGEIQPWFQPIVDLRTGDLRGFEALARWLPSNGITRAPDEWLRTAEETGLVVAVDRAVSAAALSQLASWRAEHATAHGLHLAINLSGRTLQQAGIAEDLLDRLTELALPANRIIVEVNEAVLIDDPAVSARLQTLRTAGIRVALDDFGTGWSSLSYLQKFPVDLLKLDRTFTSQLGPKPGSNAIPAAVLQLARAMSLAVIAEGVETIDQLNSLLDLGFNQAQGYLFAAAQPAQNLHDLLRHRHPNLRRADSSERAGAGDTAIALTRPTHAPAEPTLIGG